MSATIQFFAQWGRVVCEQAFERLRTLAARVRQSGAAIRGRPRFSDLAGRYKSLIVDGSGDGYLRSVCDYVHLNPARVRGSAMLPVDQPLKRFAWSSWPAYLLAPSKRPAWLRVDRLLGEWGIPKDSPAGRRQLERRGTKGSVLDIDTYGSTGHSRVMARKMRVEYPGAIYHTMNRGDRREPIFLDDADRQRFVETLAEVCAKTGWQVHAYVLMPNHFHLVVETPQPNLVAGMKWFLGTYTSRFNRRHKLSGHLFAGRYKSLIVDGSGDGYLGSVCDYVHLNPARVRGSGMLPVDQPLKRFAWSSWPAYLVAPSKRPAWLRVDRLLGEWGIPKDSPAGRRQLERALEARRGEDNEEFHLVRRGWCLGDETFRQELLTQMREGIGAEHYGEERAQTAEAMAEQIIAEELKRRRWTEAALRARPKGDPAKVALAARLRAETTMTVGWIAERLGMGSRGYLNHLLYRQRKSGRK